jgi:hypothetical protein
VYLNGAGPIAAAPASAGFYYLTGSLLAAGVVFVAGSVSIMLAARHRRRHDLRTIRD